MKTEQDLREALNRMDHKSYPAYKELKGSYVFDGYLMCIEHVQGDPFAAPSKVSVTIRGDKAQFPAALYDMDVDFFSQFAERLTEAKQLLSQV